MKRSIFVVLVLTLVCLFQCAPVYADTGISETEIENIVGGLRFENGAVHELSAEEAKAARLNEILNETYLIQERLNMISPRVVVSTELTSQVGFKGDNITLSGPVYNQTSNPVVRVLSYSHTFESSVTVGAAADIEISEIVDTFNAEFTKEISESITMSTTDTVTINPNEKFYATFTPDYVRISGRQLVYTTHGYSTWKDFTVECPVLQAGSISGTLYYITEPI